MKPIRIGAAKPTVRVGPKPAHDWPAIAELLRNDPGTWYEVARFAFQTNEAHRIKTGANPAFRDGTWDAMRESTEDGYVVYACYLGEAE